MHLLPSWLRSSLFASLALAGLGPLASAQAELDAVWPPNPTDFQLTGTHVALSEFWLAVSDEFAQTSAGASPRVLMYRRDGNSWTFDSIVQSPGYLTSLAMADDALLLGSSSSTTQHPGGKVRVFEHLNGSWQRTQTLTGQDPTQQDAFGTALAATRDRIVVGANAETDPQQPQNATGAVYVYGRTAAGWTLESRLVSGSSSARQIGRSVAVSGDLVATVSAGGPFGLLPAVEVFEHSGGTWGWTDRVSSPPSPSNFGKSIAIDSSGYIAVGDERGGAGNPERAGSVSVYERQGAQYTLLQELTHPTPIRFDEFGDAVTWVNGTLIVGAPHWDPAGLPLINGPGSLEIFRRAAGASGFSHIGRRVASLGTDDDYVGWSLAAFDGLVATGTPFRRLGANLVGGASVFRFGGAVGTVICDSNPNSTGSVGSLLAFGSSDPATNELSLIGYGLPPNTVALGIVSPEAGFTPFVPGSQGSLCIGGSIGRLLESLQTTNNVGRFTIPLDLTAVPTPVGTAAVVPGDVWFFQAWYRDANPSSTSNFTDAVRVDF